MKWILCIMPKLKFYVNKVALAILIHTLLLLSVIVESEPFTGGGGSGGGSFGSSQIGIHVGGIMEQKCPRVCSCYDHAVNCSHRGLTQVPRKIPPDTERL